MAGCAVKRPLAARVRTAFFRWLRRWPLLGWLTTCGADLPGGDVAPAIEKARRPAASEVRPGRAPLTDAEATLVGRVAAGWFREGDPPVEGLPGRFGRARGVVYAAARVQGERLAHVWHEANTGAEALRGAVRILRERLSAGQRAEVTHLEITLAHSFRRVTLPDDASRLAPIYRGLWGLELVHAGRAWRYAPTEFIAFNLSFERALERLAERAGAPAPARGVMAGGLRGPIRLFAADQLLVDLSGTEPRTTRLYRGNRVVPIESVTRAAVEALARLQAQWLTNNLQPDGRLPYLYWPSRGEESPANNQLRQWMATRALLRLARTCKDPDLAERADRNVRYNLAHSFSEDPAGHGLITDRGGAVKLGAVALAWLALNEHPQAARYAPQARALLKTTDALWQTNGEFHTFWHPPERRGDNVNFYPGEALLAWAAHYEQTREPSRLERFRHSVRFYRDWHRAHRNPAFVPWHTLACARVWALTREADLRDWIFEMNDWLLPLQQWDEQREFPDTMGRFYAPDQPYGPPHASSTGVYLEGLIAAWRVACAADDAARQEAYRRAIVRGLRSLCQLTFKDETDLFYVARRERVVGGVRTTVYDNTIRVDNVQHSLMALWDILEAFRPEDFRP